MVRHRGTDPQAIEIADQLGLTFDGMMETFYQFTVAKGPEGAKGITFYATDLTQVEPRLQEKFREFGIPVNPVLTIEALDKAAVNLFIKRHGKKAYESGEAGETLERITQKAEDFDPVFLKQHPDLKGQEIVVYHDPLTGDDLVVIEEERVVEIFSKELKANLNNPADLSKIRTQLVLLKTDTERVAPELESFHRSAIESLIQRMAACDFDGVLTEYSKLKAAGEMLVHRAMKSDIDVTRRIDTIDTLLRETLIEIATEHCQCKLFKSEEGG